MNALVPRALTGEALADLYVRVVWRPHPLQDRREVHHLPAGATLSEIVEDVAGTGEGIRAFADGRPVAPADWATTLPFRDVTLARVPRPPVAALIPVIAAAAGSVFGGALGTAILGGALSTTILGVTISAATIGAAIITGVGAILALGVSLLFRPSPPQLTQQNNRPASPTYQISGVGNRLDPYGIVPLVLGRHRYFPPFAAKPYTELVGRDQYLNCLFVLSSGSVQVSEAKIGETPVGAYEDVSHGVLYYTPGQPLPPAVCNLVDEEALNVDLGTSEAPLTSAPRTAEPGATAISIDIVAPRGIYFVNGDGNDRPHTVIINIQYRRAGTATWDAAWTGAWLAGSVRGETVRKGFRFAVDPGPDGDHQYEVRIVNTGHRHGDPKALSTEDQVIWTVLRSHRFQQPVTFAEPCTLAALRIRASDQLAGQIDDYNVIVQQMGRKYLGGGAWAGWEPIQSPADIFFTLLTHPSNSRPVPDAEVHFASLNAWAEDCLTKGWKFNQVRDFAGSFFDCQRDVCASGRGEPAMIDGKWGVIWEREVPLPVVQAITPLNSWGFTGERIYAEEPHAFRVTFRNERAAFEQDEMFVYADGYHKGNATLFESLELPGVTDPDLIHKLGRYYMAERLLRREIYATEIDMEHLPIERGDRVRVNHDVPYFGLGAARVKAVSATGVTLDEPILMVHPKLYALNFRSVSGAQHKDLIRAIVTVEGEFDTVAFADTGDLPEIGDIAMFGEVDRASIIARVLSVEPGADWTARLTLVDDGLGVLTADSGPIPPFETNISFGASALDFQSTDLRVTERVLFEGQATVTELRFSWAPPRISGIAWHQVQWRAVATETTWTRSASVEPGNNFFVVRVPPGEWEFRVRQHLSQPLGRPGRITQWASIRYYADDAFQPPPAVTGARIVVTGSRAVISWNNAVEGVRAVEIRHSPLLDGAVVSVSRVLVARATGGQWEVPSLKGTYLLRWEGGYGQHSTSAVTIINAIGEAELANVVETLAQHPTFPGPTVGPLSVSGGVLKLPGGSEAIYYFLGGVNLGAVYPCRISVEMDLYAANTVETYFGDDGTRKYFQPGGKWFRVDPDDWEVTAEYRETDDDPSGTPVWGPWTQVDRTEVAGRGFQFRLRLQSTNPDVELGVSKLTAIVDMPDRVEGWDDIAIAAAGTRVTFDPAFFRVPTVGVTAQNAPEGAKLVISNKTVDGVTVRVVAGGVGVAAVCDVLAKGYGRII